MSEVFTISYRSKSIDQNENVFINVEAERKFQVIWDQLTCIVKNKNNEEKIILNQFSGKVKSGEMVALLGPSGAGKSTFLNCLVGKRKPESGSITYWSNEKCADIAYVPQKDHLPLFLTVKESLMLASKIKNKLSTINTDCDQSKQHEQLVEEILKNFHMQDCDNNLIKYCSGGEAKRLSIALEMISEPNFLVLDEPTSGLDSFIAFQCMNLLKNVVKSTKNNRQPTVLTTIHQPSSDLFHLFDKVYLLSRGRCIYEGEPSAIVEKFNSFNLEFPVYCNPADFALDIAAGNEGSDIIFKLNSNYLETNEIKQSSSSSTAMKTDSNLRVVKRKSGNYQVSHLQIYFLLVGKLIKSSFRDPMQAVFRLVAFLTIPVILGLSFRPNASNESGCLYQIYNETHYLPENAYQRFDRKEYGMENARIMVYNSLFAFIIAVIPIILSFSNHMNVFYKEYANNWYSIVHYFFASITTTIIFGFFFACLNAVTLFFITKQIFTWSRIWSLIFTMTMFGLAGDFCGILIAALIPNLPMLGMTIAGTVSFLNMVFSGSLVRIADMPLVAQYISDLFVVRFVTNFFLKTYFDNERCLIDNEKFFTFNQVIDFVNYYNHERNGEFNLQQIRSIPLKVRGVLEAREWRRDDIIDFYEYINDFNAVQRKDLQNFWLEKANYIFDEFNIYFISIGQTCFFIFLHVFIIIAFIYVALLFKARKLR